MIGKMNYQTRKARCGKVCVTCYHLCRKKKEGKKRGHKLPCKHPGSHWMNMFSSVQFSLSVVSDSATP